MEAFGFSPEPALPFRRRGARRLEYGRVPPHRGEGRARGPRDVGQHRPRPRVLPGSEGARLTRCDTIPLMKGTPAVIGRLQLALKEELTAINQYFLHAEMCENWKYDKLATHIRHESIDEMRHAEALIERILFLDGVPAMTEPMQLSVGSNVKSQLEGDLKLEIEAVEMYNRFVRLARDENDNASRELFERLLKDEEA